MKRNMWVIALVASVSVLLTAVVTLQGQGTQGPRPVTVAVVDIQKVFDGLNERSAIEANITSRAEKLQQEEQAKRTEIQQLQSDLSVLSPDSDAYRQTRDKLDEKLIQLQAWREYRQRQIEREKALQIENLYRKALSAVQRISERAGYELVLYHDQSENLQGQNQQQLAAMIQVRKVLYAAPNLDITNQVVQMMNNEFDNR